jgi:hypothetical protein
MSLPTSSVDVSKMRGQGPKALHDVVLPEGGKRTWQICKSAPDIKSQAAFGRKHRAWRQNPAYDAAAQQTESTKTKIARVSSLFAFNSLFIERDSL